MKTPEKLRTIIFLVACATPRMEPTPVTITEDDVADVRAANRQEQLERAIRDDIERAQNWSDDNDD